MENNDYIGMNMSEEELERELGGLQGQMDMGMEYDAQEESAPESKPARPKKKSVRRRYGQIALAAIVAAVVLLVLLIIFVALNRTRTGREDTLRTAYEKYTSGDTAALEEIRTLSAQYEPAQIVLQLIEEASSAAATEEPAEEETFGNAPAVSPSPSQAPQQATSTEGSSAEESSTQEPALQTNPNTEGETAAGGTLYVKDDDKAEPESDEVADARQLWSDGEYEEAKDAFDTLAASGALAFSTTGAKSGDEVLSYGAICGMLDLYQKESPYLYYTDALIYVCKDIPAETGYDFTKPIYLFDIETGDYLCAYSTSVNGYVFWSNKTDDVSLVKKGKKYDLLSISSLLSIRKKLQ